MKRFVIALFVSLVATLHATTLYAQNDPGVVIRTAVDRAFDVLRDPALKKAEKRNERLAKLRVIADGVFDWETMAQSSLGAPYRSISEEQRKEFVALFKDLIAQEYMDDLDRFIGDEKVTIAGIQARGEQRVVKTILVTHSRERVPIDYFMRRKDEKWVAQDFSVEGVSLVNHYRQTFARFLANHTFDQLLERLRTRAKPK